MQYLFRFIADIFKHWSGLLTGGVGVAVLFIYEHLAQTTISVKYSIAFIAYGLMASCFLAWRDKVNELDALKISPLSQLEKRNTLDAYIAKGQEYLDNLHNTQWESHEGFDEEWLNETLAFVGKYFTIKEYDRVKGYYLDVVTAIDLSLKVTKKVMKSEEYQKQRDVIRRIQALKELRGTIL